MNLVLRLLDDWEQFSVPIRLGRGVNAAAYESLCKTLRDCRKEWSSSDSIPKKAAGVFIDAGLGLTSTTQLYSPKEQDQILVATDEILGLMRESINGDGEIS